MAEMALAAWISLAFLVGAVGGTGAYAGVRAWRTYKAFRAFSGAATAGLDDVLRRAGEAEEHALAATRSGEQLAAAVARLQASLARLTILRDAASEARATLTFRLPTK
jgi:hypothetical protein